MTAYLNTKLRAIRLSVWSSGYQIDGNFCKTRPPERWVIVFPLRPRMCPMYGKYGPAGVAGDKLPYHWLAMSPPSWVWRHLAALRYFVDGENWKRWNAFNTENIMRFKITNFHALFKVITNLVCIMVQGQKLTKLVEFCTPLDRYSKYIFRYLKLGRHILFAGTATFKTILIPLHHCRRPFIGFLTKCYACNMALKLPFSVGQDIPPWERFLPSSLISCMMTLYINLISPPQWFLVNGK